MYILYMYLHAYLSQAVELHPVDEYSQEEEVNVSQRL